MPSQSLNRWKGERADALDEIESAHAIVGGIERGRRYATQQINYSYAALLSAHFQGFCRDLHSESIDHIVAIVPPQLQAFLRAEFIWNRGLGKGIRIQVRSGPISIGWGSISGLRYTP